MLANIQFHGDVVRRFTSADPPFGFGRSNLSPPDQTISEICGQMHFFDFGIVVERRIRSNTMIWIARPDQGRIVEVVRGYPVVVRSEDAQILVGINADIHIGHRFQVSVQLDSDDPLNTTPNNIKVPPTEERNTDPPADLKLTDRQRDALAAITVDHPAYRNSKSIVRPPARSVLKSSALHLHKADHINEAMREVANKIRARWNIEFVGENKQQHVADWALEKGVIGPEDWQRIAKQLVYPPLESDPNRPPNGM